MLYVFKVYPQIKFLLERGADTSFEMDHRTPITCAADLHDWTVVKMFAHYHSDPEDKAQYGYALLGALKHQQRDLSGILNKSRS